MTEAESILASILSVPVGSGERFVAVNGSSGLRWILPVGIPAVARLLATWRPYGALSCLKWTTLIAAARHGVLHYLPGVKSLRAEFSGVDWKAFGWDGTGPPLAILYVGTPGPRRKLIVVLADRNRGEPRLIVKFPVGSSAWPAISHEYQTLRDLSYERFIGAPVPLLLNDVARFASQSWLEGVPVGSELTSAHVSFLSSLVRPAQKIILRTMWAGLRERQVHLVQGDMLPRSISSKIDVLLSGNNWSGEVPAVLAHGDFAPWNLKRLSNGTLGAVDWEYSDEVGLPFYDLNYFRYQVSRLLGRQVRLPSHAYQNLLQGAVTDRVHRLSAAQVLMAIFGCRSFDSDEPNQYLPTGDIEY